jgi:large subunit ribosomal protein L3
MAAFLMIMQTLLGIKINQSQKFLQNGQRVPVTQINVSGNIVMQIKKQDANGYNSIQIGVGSRKNSKKSLLGHSKHSHKDNITPKFIKEARVSEETMQAESLPKVGDVITPTQVLSAGDFVAVSGTSKGKGFAGGVKRYHFKGGPRTHGQSDRERAPGSIGQTTTPGRVYKGKRMAGRMGNEKVTVQNLEVLQVTDSELWLKGLIPGSKNGLVIVSKTGENKKHIPLYSTEEQKQEETIEQTEPTPTTLPESQETPKEIPTEEKNDQETKENITNDEQKTDIQITETETEAPTENVKEEANAS